MLLERSLQQRLFPIDDNFIDDNFCSNKLEYIQTTLDPDARTEVDAQIPMKWLSLDIPKQPNAMKRNETKQALSNDEMSSIWVNGSAITGPRKQPIPTKANNIVEPDAISLYWAN